MLVLYYLLKNFLTCGLLKTSFIPSRASILFGNFINNEPELSFDLANGSRYLNIFEILKIHKKGELGQFYV
jgi:hypothetical protein